MSSGESKRLVVMGLNHKSAPVATREAFAVPAEYVPVLNRRLLQLGALGEAMTVSTCNRVEIYGVSEQAADEARHAMIQALAVERGLDPVELAAHSYFHSGVDAQRHLVRVCASLDSLVVGEAQIMAQVKEAFQLARESETAGTFLEQNVQAAFRGAKAVRSETGIASETVSIGSVAAELARRIFPRLADSRILVIGAGKMGRLTARSLARGGVKEVWVTNRSPARAEALARELGWTAKPFAQLDEWLTQADVILTCTGADRPILELTRMRQVMKARKYRPIFLVDIAVPRDISPAVTEVDGVYLYNIDDLEAVSREHLQRRMAETDKADRIIERTVAEMVTRSTQSTVFPVIRQLRAQVQSVSQQELQRAFQRKLSSLDAAQRDQVSQTLQASLNKLLHPAMEALRDHGDQRMTLVDAARLLFGLDFSQLSEETP